MSYNELNSTTFDKHPDVVNVKQMCKMLGGISEKTGYRLLHGGNIKFFTIGRSIRISKMSIIDYISTAENSAI